MSETVNAIVQDSIFLSVGNDGDELHLRHFRPVETPARDLLLLLHGAIENGRIFYSADGRKGLAPFLCQNGFEVLVGDLRGRGQSRPHVSRHSQYGQTEAITEDLSVMADFASQLAAGRPQHWLAHSWGGVLMAAHLLRYPRRIPTVASLTFFGSKRSVSARNFERYLGIDIVWNRVAKLATARYGYLPARRLKLGSDDESRLSHAQSVLWIKNKKRWIDPVDGFDYGAAVRNNPLPLPRTLSLAGVSDAYLGNPLDVESFARECGLPPGSFLLLSKANGHRKNYGHIDMLTDPEAIYDHFPLVNNWLTSRTNRAGKK